MHDDLNKCGGCDNILSSYEMQEGSCDECNYTFNSKHRQWAQQSPDIYFQKILLIDGTETTVLQMAEQLFDDKVLKVFGLFAVTTKAIECLNHTYSIEKDSLNQNDWMEYMKVKRWVNVDDFSAALGYATESCKR